MKNNKLINAINKLFFWAFMLKVFYLIYIVLITVFQNLVKKIYMASNDLQNAFCIPIDTLLICILSGVIMLVFWLQIKKQIEEKEDSMVLEIVGVVLFSGIIPLLSSILNTFTTLLISRMGTAQIASFSTMTHAAGMLGVVSYAGTGIFIMACGMALVLKKTTA